MSLTAEDVDIFDYAAMCVAGGELSAEHSVLLRAQTRLAIPARSDRLPEYPPYVDPSPFVQSAWATRGLDRHFEQYADAIRLDLPPDRVNSASESLWRESDRHGALGRAALLFRLVETGSIGKFSECLSEVEMSSPTFLPFRLAAEGAQTSVSSIEYLLQLAEQFEKAGQLESAFAVVQAIGDYDKDFVLRLQLRRCTVYAKLAFRFSCYERATFDLHKYHLYAFGRSTEQPVVYEIATAADLQPSPDAPLEIAHEWPTFMPRVDFRRLSSTYDSRVKTIDLIDAAVLCTTPLNSYLQIILWNSKLFVDDLNIHPRYFVGLPDSPLLASDRSALLTMFFYQQRRVRLKGLSLLLGGAPNYYHWMFEYLPRLEAVEADKIYDHVLINPNFQSWQGDLLQIIRPDIARIPRQQLTGDAFYECEQLSAPTVRPLADAVPYLSRCLKAAKMAEGARIFISRADADPRRVRISDEAAFFEQSLRPLGFQSVTLSSLSVSQQLDLFRRASIVVAAHGAGLSNIVVSAPDCIVVEINNSANVTYTFFEAIASVRGQKFVRFLGEDSSQVSGMREDIAVHIDPRQFNQAIGALI